MRLLFELVKGFGISIAITIGGLAAFVVFAVVSLLRLALYVVTGGAMVGATFSGIGLLRDGWHAHSWLSNTFQHCGLTAVLGLMIIVIVQQLVERYLPANAR